MSSDNSQQPDDKKEDADNNSGDDVKTKNNNPLIYIVSFIPTRKQIAAMNPLPTMYAEAKKAFDFTKLSQSISGKLSESSKGMGDKTLANAPAKSPGKGGLSL